MSFAEQAEQEYAKTGLLPNLGQRTKPVDFCPEGRADLHVFPDGSMLAYAYNSDRLFIVESEEG